MSHLPPTSRPIASDESQHWQRSFADAYSAAGDFFIVVQAGDSLEVALQRLAQVSELIEHIRALVWSKVGNIGRRHGVDLNPTGSEFANSGDVRGGVGKWRGSVHFHSCGNY